MRNTMRARNRTAPRATAVATMALVATLASACGSSDSTGAGASDTPSASASTSASESPSSSAPTSASTGASTSAAVPASDFCSAYGDLVTQLTAGGKFDVKVLKDGVTKIEDAGLPEGAPPDVAAGLKVTADAVLGLPDDATEQDLTKAGTSFSKAEQAQTKKFSDYVLAQCADELNLPTGAPSASTVTPSAP